MFGKKPAKPRKPKGIFGEDAPYKTPTLVYTFWENIDGGSTLDWTVEASLASMVRHLKEPAVDVVLYTYQPGKLAPRKDIPLAQGGTASIEVRDAREVLSEATFKRMLEKGYKIAQFCDIFRYKVAAGKAKQPKQYDRAIWVDADMLVCRRIPQPHPEDKGHMFCSMPSKWSPPYGSAKKPDWHITLLPGEKDPRRKLWQKNDFTGQFVNSFFSVPMGCELMQAVYDQCCALLKEKDTPERAKKDYFLFLNVLKMAVRDSGLRASIYPQPAFSGLHYHKVELLLEPAHVHRDWRCSNGSRIWFDSKVALAEELLNWRPEEGGPVAFQMYQNIRNQVLRLGLAFDGHCVLGSGLEPLLRRSLGSAFDSVLGVSGKIARPLLPSRERKRKERNDGAAAASRPVTRQDKKLKRSSKARS